MDNFRRTALGGLSQTCAMMGLPLPRIANTTLNEKLSIQANATLGVNETPRAKYMCIGIGGHQGTVGADGILLIGSAQHRPTDNSLFRMMPFVMRPLANDLTSTERQRYALRRIENHKGLDYAVYYLRRLDLTNVVPKLQKINITNGVTTTTDYTPTSGDLSPTPPALNTGGANTVTGEFIAAVARVTVNFDTLDATEILNAAMVLFDSEEYAIISEMGFVSGVDRSVTVTDPNGALVYDECINAQIVTHIATLQKLVANRNGFESVFDVGATEPMYNLTTP